MVKKFLSAASFLLFIVVSVCTISQGFADADSDFADALAHVEDGDYVRAAEDLESLLQRQLEKTPLDEQAIHHLLGYCYEKQEKWAQAVEHYLQVISANYDLADYVTYRLATSYRQMDDDSSAAIWYQHLIDEYPQNPHFATAKYEIAKMYQKQGDYTKALEGFADLIAQPHTGYARQATYESAQAYEALQNWREAHLTYGKLIDANASDEIARRSVERLQRLVKDHPNLPITRSRRMTHGMVLYNNRKFAAARTEFRNVAEGHSDALTGRATYYIGRSYHRQRKYSLAIKAYNKVASLYPSSGYLTRALYQTTLCYRRKGQPDLAQKHLNAFIENYDWSALADNALYDLGWVQENEKQYDEAIASYRRLTRTYRKSDFVPQAYWRIGWIQFKNKQYEDSIKTFALLIALFPKNSYAMAGHFWMAKSYERQGEWEAAEKTYREIVQANHWYYSSRAQEQLKQRAEQAQSSADSVSDAPIGELGRFRTQVVSDSPIWKNLGSKATPRVEKLMRLKFFEDAVTELKKTIASDRSNLADSYYNLVVCYEKLKKFQEAHLYADKLSRFQFLRDQNQAIPLELYQRLYPFYYSDIIGKHSSTYEIDPLFVASMIREESRYNAEIVSWAGALGLMQIMPSTGRELARHLKIRRFRRDMLFDPDINIQMGISYMKDLMDRFENNLAFVAGAYNGGPGRMQRWLREMDTSDLDEFIEDIPIAETRRHIKKVLDSYYIYQELYVEPESPSTQKS